jgi:nucleoside-diphosphate-sugar epimerase
VPNQTIISTGVDVIVHVAGDLQTSIMSSPVSVLDSNLMSTLGLLECAKRHGVARFIFISSCAVYGARLETDEDAVVSPSFINGIYQTA